MNALYEIVAHLIPGLENKVKLFPSPKPYPLVTAWKQAGFSEADHLIVVAAARNSRTPALYRLAGEEISNSVLAKDPLHEVDLLESLTMCRHWTKFQKQLSSDEILLEA
ncbi:hypothetical protein ACFL0Q_06780 [Thermodesulfobacteriota bacterium]